MPTTVRQAQHRFTEAELAVRTRLACRKFHSLQVALSRLQVSKEAPSSSSTEWDTDYAREIERAMLAVLKGHVSAREGGGWTLSENGLRLAAELGLDVPAETSETQPELERSRPERMSAASCTTEAWAAYMMSIAIDNFDNDDNKKVEEEQVEEPEKVEEPCKAFCVSCNNYVTELAKTKEPKFCFVCGLHLSPSAPLSQPCAQYLSCQCTCFIWFFQSEAEERESLNTACICRFCGDSVEFVVPRPNGTGWMMVNASHFPGGVPLGPLGLGGLGRSGRLAPFKAALALPNISISLPALRLSLRLRRRLYSSRMREAKARKKAVAAARTAALKQQCARMRLAKNCYNAEKTAARIATTGKVQTLKLGSPTSQSPCLGTFHGMPVVCYGRHRLRATSDRIGRCRREKETRDVSRSLLSELVAVSDN